MPKDTNLELLELQLNAARDRWAEYVDARDGEYDAERERENADIAFVNLMEAVRYIVTLAHDAERMTVDQS